MPPRLLTILLCLSLAGCSVYDTRFAYLPHPAESETLIGDDEQEMVRALVSVVGVRHDDAESGLPASVELRLQVENRTDAPVDVDPTELRLVSGDLVAFPAPIVEPEEAVRLSPGEEVTFTAFFPFPEGASGAMDLTGLDFRWSYDVAPDQLVESVTFTRRRAQLGSPYRHHFGYTYGYPRGFWYRDCR